MSQLHLFFSINFVRGSVSLSHMYTCNVPHTLPVRENSQSPYILNSGELLSHCRHEKSLRTLPWWGKSPYTTVMGKLCTHCFHEDFQHNVVTRKLSTHCLQNWKLYTHCRRENSSNNTVTRKQSWEFPIHFCHEKTLHTLPSCKNSLNAAITRKLTTNCYKEKTPHFAASVKVSTRGRNGKTFNKLPSRKNSTHCIHRKTFHTLLSRRNSTSCRNVGSLYPLPSWENSWGTRSHYGNTPHTAVTGKPSTLGQSQEIHSYTTDIRKHAAITGKLSQTTDRTRILHAESLHSLPSRETLRKHCRHEKTLYKCTSKK